MQGIRLFRSRFVDETKGKATNIPYEKSRLVIQAYNDQGKTEILTQSPTIQRVSQRLIIAITPSLLRLNIYLYLYLREITQAYVQSTTTLNRLILAKPPKEIACSLPPDTIMRVLKPLYGIAEAGSHWFTTYHNHHRLRLEMNTSTYDICLLISTGEHFGLVGMQIDDTLFLADNKIAELENLELQKVGFLAKQVEILSLKHSLIFNGCKLNKISDCIELVQKGQADRLKLVEVDGINPKESYRE